MKSMIKRIIVGIIVSLAVFLIKKNVFALDITSYTMGNQLDTITSVNDLVYYDLPNIWANYGVGYVYFDFSIYKVGGDSVSTIVMPRGVYVESGSSGYVCNVGSVSSGNSTWTGTTFSARCPTKLSSSGLSRIVIYLNDNQQNNNGTYRVRFNGLITLEYGTTTNVNVDTSGTTNAINNQITNDNQNTQSIINNQNNNTQSIINNQNNNTQSIINNDKQNTQQMIDNNNQLLGSTPCTNLFKPFSYTRLNNGVNFTYNQNGTITASGTATASATSILRDTVVNNGYYITLTPGTYTLSGGIDSNKRLQLLNSSDGTVLTSTSSSGNSTFTLSNTTLVYLRANVSNGTSLDTTFYPKIETGSTATSFCMYGSYNSKLDDTNNSLNEVNDNLTETNDMLKNHNVSSSTGFAQDFFANYNLNTHGLTAIITAPLRLFSSLIGANCTSLRFQLPFVHNEVQLQCMSSIYETHFSSFLLIYRLITDGIIAYWVSVKVFQKVKGFLDPTDDKVEVFDL